ncbi:MAG: hypothetical protein FJX52_13755, partial [Alphaproteobacteria bacterium]|nr:hypothetical protein [Alphaproteobacteria bacterium]
IPAPQFRAALRDNHEFALAVLHAFAGYWRLLVRQIKELKLKTATQRLGSFLLSLTDQRSGTVTVVVRGERRILARRLGMTPESLSRAFSDLRQHGISGRVKRFVIADVKKLREYCQEDDLILALFRRLRRRADTLDACRAEFEFRNLAERIKLRIGQDIGRRLGVAEWNENHAGAQRAVGARFQLDRSAPGHDPNPVASDSADPAQIGRRQ